MAVTEEKHIELKKLHILNKNFISAVKIFFGENEIKYSGLQQISTVLTDIPH